MSREIMQQALDALEMHVLGFDGVRKMELAIEALETALAQPDETETLKRCLFQMQEAAKVLAQPEQEPINKMPTKIFGPNLEQILNAAGFYKREWVGLTDEEIKGILDCGRGGLVDIKKAEQILKDKNG